MKKVVNSEEKGECSEPLDDFWSFFLSVGKQLSLVQQTKMTFFPFQNHKSKEKLIFSREQRICTLSKKSSMTKFDKSPKLSQI